MNYRKKKREGLENRDIPIYYRDAHRGPPARMWEIDDVSSALTLNL